MAMFALDLLEVDRHGLDQSDRMILRTIIEKFAGGPVGLDTLAAALGETRGRWKTSMNHIFCRTDF